MTTIDLSNSSEDECEYEISDSNDYSVDSKNLSTSAKESSRNYFDLTNDDDRDDDVEEYADDDLNDKKLYWNRIESVTTTFDEDPPPSFPHLSENFWLKIHCFFKYSS